VREKSDGTRARDARSRFAIRATRRDATRRAIARESPAAIER
jgi:hypothetical protein